jgi:hypothetical protein
MMLYLIAAAIIEAIFNKIIARVAVRRAKEDEEGHDVV